MICVNLDNILFWRFKSNQSILFSSRSWHVYAIDWVLMIFLTFNHLLSFTHLQIGRFCFGNGA